MPDGKDIHGKKPGVRTLYAGVGNVLRSDDGVGVEICHRIKPDRDTLVLPVEVSIENYIGKINGLNPQRLVLIDSVDFGREPGYWEFLPVEQLRDHTFHTHHISLKTITQLFHMPVWILGIQPLTTAIGEGLSPAVKAAAEKIAGMINKPASYSNCEETVTSEIRST